MTQEDPKLTGVLRKRYEELWQDGVQLQGQIDREKSELSLGKDDDLDPQSRVMKRFHDNFTKRSEIIRLAAEANVDLHGEES